MQRAPLLLGGSLVIVVAAALSLSGPLGGGASPAAPRPAGPAASVAERATPSATASGAAPTLVASPVPGALPLPPSPSPQPSGPMADVPIVPVTRFRAAWVDTDKAEVAAVLAGRSKRYDALELVAAEAEPILAALGLDPVASHSRLVLAPDAAALAADLTGHAKRLGFLRADAVRPAVRALGWGGARLFGVDRVRKASKWSLDALLPAGGAPFDPTRTWTLVAGGDIMLDRGVAQTLTIRGKGADFPFDGGAASITGHTCCSSFGWPTPLTQREGDAGAMRHLVEGADLAIANFENPAPDAFRYHMGGTIFSADPSLIKGLAKAGLDWVGLANNHIRNAGGVGILQTIKNLDRYGIRSSGAGKDLASARTPAILDADGVQVAMLAYDTIARADTASPDRAGSARFTTAAVKADVAAARAAGAQVVIVFPHWGTEYDPSPFDGQRRLAKAAIDAGADMVIGNHAHWAGAVEVYRGKPIWYALGNFIFDQTWSEPTMEGITLELTFRAADLVQVRMRPHIILDKAQPNFLDPAGDGRVVMGRIFDASKGLLPW